MRRLALLALALAGCATAKVEPQPPGADESLALQLMHQLDAGEVQVGLTDGLRAVLHEDLSALGREWKATHGALRWARVVKHSGNAWDVDAVWASSPFPERWVLVFDGQQRLSGLWFHGASSGLLSAGELQDALAALPGQVSAFVQAAEHREVQLGYRAGEPQSVASQFKVMLLARACIDVGRHLRSLDDRIALPAEVRGVPSCVLCQFDPGLRPTLRDLLHLLVSASDNTAADLLRELYGPDDVTRFAELNGIEHPPPLVSTQGLFALECGLGPLREVPVDQRWKVLAAMSPDQRVAAADDAAHDGFGTRGAAQFWSRCPEGHSTAEAGKAIAHVVDWPMRADELVALYTNAQLGQLDSPEASQCFLDFMREGGGGPIPLGGAFPEAGTKNGIEQDVRSVGVVVQTDRGPIAVSVSAQQFPDAQADKMLDLVYQAAHALVSWAYAQLPAR